MPSRWSHRNFKNTWKQRISSQQSQRTLCRNLSRGKIRENQSTSKKSKRTVNGKCSKGIQNPREMSFLSSNVKSAVHFVERKEKTGQGNFRSLFFLRKRIQKNRSYADNWKLIDEETDKIAVRKTNYKTKWLGQWKE